MGAGQGRAEQGRAEQGTLIMEERQIILELGTLLPFPKMRAIMITQSLKCCPNFKTFV